MDCGILRTLYVKANGQIRCNDDIGEQVVLGAVEADDPDWTIANVLANDQYDHIRKALADGRVPWDGVCDQCPFLLRDGSPHDSLAERRIPILQLEPTLACNLRCPCCSNRAQLRERPRPHTMPVGMWERLLRSLRDGGYEVEAIEYCGQGEPLMHPEFAEFTRLSRRYFPSAFQELTTNGNFDYASKLADAQLDQVLVAGDGVWQESYEKYRVRGDVSQVLQFMRDANQQNSERRPTVCWKYILFEFNDSTEELLEAQRLAQEIGVDRLLFIVTGSRYRSQKYSHDNLHTLPIESDLVDINLHPVLDLAARNGEDQRHPWLDEMRDEPASAPAPEPEPTPSRAQGPGATPLHRICGRRLAKLIRHPAAFSRDSRHLLIRALGEALHRRGLLWRWRRSAFRSEHPRA